MIAVWCYCDFILFQGSLKFGLYEVFKDVYSAFAGIVQYVLLINTAGYPTWIFLRTRHDNKQMSMAEQRTAFHEQ